MPNYDGKIGKKATSRSLIFKLDVTSTAGARRMMVYS